MKVKIRTRLLTLIDEKEGKNRKSECDKIREQIMDCFVSPRLMWQETSRERKAYRKVYSALGQGTTKGIKMRIEEIDKIWGHKNW
ncbi:hypothetical protein KAW18_12690 [candidate division WOR-3 bacterium]|nr:hypothetical protein [candidate division WOR-3 bacterium]